MQIAHGSHKSPTVRTKVASHLDRAMALTNTGAILVNNWGLLEKLFRTAAGFLDEGALETRTYGKRLVWECKRIVGNKSDFDRLRAGVRPAGLQKKVQSFVESATGPPPAPARVQGSRQQSLSNPERPLVAGRSKPMDLKLSGSAAQSQVVSPPNARSGGGGSILARNGRAQDKPLLAAAADGGVSVSLMAVPRPPGSTTPERSRYGGHAGGGAIARPGSLSARAPVAPEALESLSRLAQQLSAKDWRQRMEALKGLEASVKDLAAAPDSALMQVMDTITPRLTDGNSKVATTALEVRGPPSGGPFMAASRASLVRAIIGGVSLWDCTASSHACSRASLYRGFDGNLPTAQYIICECGC